MYLILEKHHHSAAVHLLPTQETKADSQAPCLCLYLVCCQSLYVSSGQLDLYQMQFACFAW